MRNKLDLKDEEILRARIAGVKYHGFISDLHSASKLNRHHLSSVINGGSRKTGRRMTPTTYLHILKFVESVEKNGRPERKPKKKAKKVLKDLQ